MLFVFVVVVVFFCFFLYCSVAEAKIDHKDILIELPVTLRNSRLVNSLLCELDTRDTKPDCTHFLGLSARYEKGLKEMSRLGIISGLVL